MTSTECACAACQPRHASPLQPSSHRFVFPFAVTAYCGSLSSPPIPRAADHSPDWTGRGCAPMSERSASRRAPGDGRETGDALRGRGGWGWGWPRNAGAPSGGSPSRFERGSHESLLHNTKRDGDEDVAQFQSTRNTIPSFGATTPTSLLPLAGAAVGSTSAGWLPRCLHPLLTPLRTTPQPNPSPDQVMALPSADLTSDRSLWRPTPRNAVSTRSSARFPFSRKRPRATQDPSPQSCP